MKRILKRIRDGIRKITGSKSEARPQAARSAHAAPKLAVEHVAAKPQPSEQFSPGGSQPERRRRPRRRRPRGERKEAGAQAQQPQQRAHEPAARQPEPPPTMEGWDVSMFHVPPEEGKTRFHDLGLPAEVMRAIDDLGFQYCTPIQAGILPHTLAGKDASGRAQTGTGKTAAFLITMLTRMMRNPAPGRAAATPRALILAPTRELVIQIAKEAEALGRYCGVNVVAVFGGMDYKRQMQDLSRGPVDIVAATPGRLLDFKNQRRIHLSKVETLVIDEADRMLDMGFIPDVRTIVQSVPAAGERQTMFFSATLTDDVMKLAARWTHEPVKVEIEPEKATVDTVKQVVYIVSGDEKFKVLYNLLAREKDRPVLVFANRRDEAFELVRKLKAHGLTSALLSGAVEQEKRLKVLEAFRAGGIRVVVATDVAGRGIHVEGIEYVVNYHLPHDPEDYVHRIGRTGRAGATGTAISFACEEDSFFIPDIEKFIGAEIKCSYPEEELLVPTPPAQYVPSSRDDRPRPHGRPHGGGSRGGRRPPRRR